jgi:hypothetical protein
MFQSVCTLVSHRHTGCEDRPLTHGVEVLGGTVGGNTSPHDRSLTHLSSDVSDSVINVTVRRSESVWRNTDDIPDNLGGPSELSDDFLVAQSGERGVRPGVDRDLVTRHVLGQQHLGSRQDS